MNPERVVWDAVIVGTGMGGATIGYALAKEGRRVLFVERGLHLHAPGASPIAGRFVEDNPGFRRLARQAREHELARGGRSTDAIRDLVRPSGAPAVFSPYIGCGTGGSTALYGMALERFFPADMSSWPISYEELRPWYDEAERLFQVRGGTDPLRHDETSLELPIAPLSESGAFIFDTLVTRGIHPYRLHTTCENAPGCQTCQGYLCPNGCKKDAATVCLMPALAEHGASLLTECTALSIDADRTSVQRLVCSWRGHPLTLRAKVFVLAAGALLTPALLLNSTAAQWPNGVANDSKVIGQFVMRHAIDLYLLRNAPPLRDDAPAKEIAFNDFYQTDSGKFGAVQSFGFPMPLEYLRNRPGFNIWRAPRPLAGWLWARYSRQPILASILEDSALANNCVKPHQKFSGHGPLQLALNYRLSAGDQRRREQFRAAVTRSLAPFKPARVRGTTDRAALGHVCGTCRFGNDPHTSALNRWNRAHGLSNLYVIDASFFPTSGGTNPALTIAANALRVAYHVNSEMRSGSHATS